MRCRYDSEEERVKERLETLEIRRREKQQAARERALLDEYRATLKSKQYYWASSPSTRTASYEDADRSLDESVIIQEHVGAWSVFEKMHAHLNGEEEHHILVFSDIPWIPKEVSKVQYLSYISDVFHEKDLKKAYAAVCLIWHPDKFQNKFKGLFILEEWDKVISKVNETFQEFRDAWETLNALSI